MISSAPSPVSFLSSEILPVPVYSPDFDGRFLTGTSYLPRFCTLPVVSNSSCLHTHGSYALHGTSYIAIPGFHRSHDPRPVPKNVFLCMFHCFSLCFYACDSYDSVIDSLCHPLFLSMNGSVYFTSGILCCVFQMGGGRYDIFMHVIFIKGKLRLRNDLFSCAYPYCSIPINWSKR